MRSTPQSTNTLPQAPRLLPAGLRLAAAAAALALVAAGWMGAGQASAQALAGLAGAPVLHVTLPAVTVVGHRDAAAASVACATGARATL
ncbi:MULTISPECIES: hypothetical protein [Ramlibacter]|uniref:Uncharacterized protein n=1 Tax=Ramlibacter aquaticus TaxID=2780094 RepID=A0ABR9SFR3_9BURK|nr:MULTISPECIES: hypothetical protein [Ramlibacter]MBE7941183.1 hypothetical protein [Ramlibacter aquaticus]